MLPRRVDIHDALLAAQVRVVDPRCDPAVRVITFQGEGQDFTAGNDLGDFLNALPRDTSDIPVWRLLRALAGCETATVYQPSIRPDAVG